MPPVAPQLAARFRADLAALGVAPECGLALAVSGGPDSLALLLLAHAAGFAIEAATVDHGLRPESAAEAQFVARTCAALGVPHATLALAPPPASGNRSDWARRERYAALHAHADARGLGFILTAHHADDQLETMLMRLNRGSGVAGLAGIRARQGKVLRPLLGWRRDELAGIVRAAGLPPVDDPSNRDDAYDRARLRKQLAGVDWLDPQAATRSAAALAEAEEALAWAAAREAERRLRRDGPTLRLDPAGLPHELLRRLALKALAELNPEAPRPRAEALERLIAALQAEGTATLAGVKCRGGEMWAFTRAPSRRQA